MAPTREELQAEIEVLQAQVLFLANFLEISTDGEWWGGSPQSKADPA